MFGAPRTCPVRRPSRSTGQRRSGRPAGSRRCSTTATGGRTRRCRDWVNDAGKIDADGDRSTPRAGRLGAPSWKVDDPVGLCYGGTHKVAALVKVAAPPRFDPAFVEGRTGSAEEGRRRPWVTEVVGVRRSTSPTPRPSPTSGSTTAACSSARDSSSPPSAATRCCSCSGPSELSAAAATRPAAGRRPGCRAGCGRGGPGRRAARRRRRACRGRAGARPRARGSWADAVGDGGEDDALRAPELAPERLVGRGGPVERVADDLDREPRRARRAGREPVGEQVGEQHRPLRVAVGEGDELAERLAGVEALGGEAVARGRRASPRSAAAPSVSGSAWPNSGRSRVSNSSRIIDGSEPA